MPGISSGEKGDYYQSRAVPVRARSHASRNAIMQAAMALWRTKGFANTTVTDICKAAGVSKALFYVYFARREDVLLAVEVFTMGDAHQAAQAVVSRPYELVEVVAAVIETLEQRARRYPPELIFEAVMETYRLERRVWADGDAEAQRTFLFSEPFAQARRDGKFPAGTDVTRAARIAQIMVTDAVRCWAASEFRDSQLARPLAEDITALILGTKP